MWEPGIHVRIRSWTTLVSCAKATSCICLLVTLRLTEGLGFSSAARAAPHYIKSYPQGRRGNIRVGTVCGGLLMVPARGTLPWSLVRARIQCVSFIFLYTTVAYA